MAYVPADAKWFIAEIVEEITVEGDQRNIVHVNFNLIRADSPEEAYAKSLELGKQCDTEYENSAAKRVQIRFRGLRNLTVMYDELEHGAELMYEERIAVPGDELEKCVRGKEQLDVFIPWKPPDFTKAPDYASKDIMDEVEHRFGLKRFEGMGESNGPDHH
jgi:hypothetical protein